MCSVVSCASGIGITNQPDLWEVIRSPHVKVYRSSIEQITPSCSQDAGQPGKSLTILLDDGVCLDNVDLVIHATGYKPIVPIRFDPPSFRLTLGLSGLVKTASEKESTADPHEPCPEVEISLDAGAQGHIDHWQSLDQRSEDLIRKTFATTGCSPAARGKPSWIGESQLLPYRLFRRMVAPELVAEGDRSFATMGVVLTSTIAVVAEVQALWVAAFLTGGFDEHVADPKTGKSASLSLGRMPRLTMERAISEDVVLGSLTGSGLEVDAIHVSTHTMCIYHMRGTIIRPMVANRTDSTTICSCAISG